jgi:glycosyltransferase involved in cell wall biosynthesis
LYLSNPKSGGDSLSFFECNKLKMRATIAVISDLSTDMRVQKQALLLTDMGYTVTLIGRYTGKSPSLFLPRVRIKRLRVLFRRGPLMYILFNVSLLLRLLTRRSDLYVANDLDTLVPCYSASRLFGKSLVYDAHEYFTGQYGLEQRKFKYSVWKKVERRLVPKVRHMITVSNSIADLYRKAYNRNNLRVGEEDLLVVYQGSGINPGRGVMELINAMTMLERIRLIITGSGDMIEEVKHAVSYKGLGNNVIFLPRMKWEEMMQFTMCCDAGLSLDPDSCINQRFSLPNKLFDYIAAGIPAIVSPLPEVSAVVDRYACGLILSHVTPYTIAGALERLRDDRGLLAELKEKALEARKVLNWENERVKEQEFFRNVIETKRHK